MRNGLLLLVPVFLCATVGCSSGSDDGTAGGQPGFGPGQDPAGPAANQAPAPGDTADADPVAAPPVTTDMGGQAGADATDNTGVEPVGDNGAVDGDCDQPSLDMEGMLYSPGGSVLPHGCEPFDPNTNNPFAIRCIDAWPWYQTQFPGDEYCILPPEPGLGIQIGVHPQGKQWHAQVSTGDLSGYENPDPQFVLQPSEEGEINYITSADNTEPKNFYRNHVRMRAGSHHMIVSGQGASPNRETWALPAPVGLFGGVGLPGAQRPDENFPRTFEKPEEDAGLYKALPANQDVVYNMHHFNSTDSPILRENWTNLWWEDDARIEIKGIFGMPLSQAATTFAQPGQTVDMHYSWNIGQDIRLLTLFGHRHAWTTAFSAWLDKPDGSQEIIYQSFDWFDEPTYRYDSMTQNPAPAPELRSDGASTGLRILKAGEELHFNCHIAYTPERAAAENAPRQPAEIGPLRFANQAFNAEMCILFGSTAAVSIGMPVNDSGAVPDFAKLE